MVRTMIRVIILAVCWMPVITLAQTTAPVYITVVKRATIAKFVEGHGILKPFPQNDIRLAALSPQRIDSIYVKPGEAVRKGQPVVKLQRDHSLEMAAQKAKISLGQAEINLNRAQKLFENGVIARIKLEQAQTEYQLAKTEYELQNSALQYAVQNSVLRSPIDGVVSSVSGVVGQVADPSRVLVHIVNVNQMIASIGVETEDIGKIKLGQPAEITIPNLSDGHVFPGTVIKQNKEIDPETQLIHIWIELENAGQVLQPGMFAVAHIIIDSDAHALVVPKSAVLHDHNGAYVYRVENDTARKTYVKPGISTDSEVQIIKGIQEGQQVVYLGNYELEDGMKVVLQTTN